MWWSTSSSAIKQRSTSHSTADCSGLVQESAKIIVSVCSGLYRMRIHSTLCRTAKQPSLTKSILSPSGKDVFTAQITRSKALLTCCEKIIPLPLKTPFPLQEKRSDCFFVNKLYKRLFQQAEPFL